MRYDDAFVVRPAEAFVNWSKRLVDDDATEFDCGTPVIYIKKNMF